ncbi:hypothetical protein SAY86_031497 [Trapa natans]|uniref:APO domain-containing protein n=1 Tax=Trapa natans TaxID=22666 RepID=A0AAN7LUC1_TRANT|nr:hypothetical protein SAY86_031497 [Trapa natans]
MWSRRVQKVAGLWKMINQGTSADLICVSSMKSPLRPFSVGSTQINFPMKLKKHEKKPMVTSMNELKRQARVVKKLRQNVQEITLRAPENGLLARELIPVAHEVYATREKLIACVSAVSESIPIYSCSSCGEVHIGDHLHQIRTCNVKASLSSKEHNWKIGGIGNVLPMVESFHLYDRVGKAVTHNERMLIDRIPAIVELCVQAGVDLPEYPIRRRTAPVYSVSGRIIDFERRFPKSDMPGKDIVTHGFWNRGRKFNKQKSMYIESDEIKVMAVQGMEAWEKMCTGALKLMTKYAVQTCGYCPEVQIGPKGHRVRNCYSYKHQMRDGQHAWQEARIDDIVPPVYVWHARDGCLINDLKRYYGKLPAVVELFAQAGAQVGEKYVSMMREDVVVPELGEERLAV